MIQQLKLSYIGDSDIFFKLIHGSNIVVKKCGNLVVDGCLSRVCNSLNVIISKYRLDRYSLTLLNPAPDIQIGQPVDTNDRHIALFIHQLCEAIFNT